MLPEMDVIAKMELHNSSVRRDLKVSGLAFDESPSMVKARMDKNEDGGLSPRF